MTDLLRRIIAVVLAAALLNGTTAVAMASVTVSGCADAGLGDVAHAAMSSVPVEPHDLDMGLTPATGEADQFSCCDVDASCTANGHCAPMFAIAAMSAPERGTLSSSFTRSDTKDFRGLHSAPSLPPPILR